jgi:phenylalanyl-tRNA synthetase beta chain
VPTSPRVGGLTPYQRERRLVRDVMAGEGVSEAIGPMLLGPGDHARAGLPDGPGNVVEADDPLVREESVLRTSLLPGLLRAVAFNAGHRNPGVRLFEIGHVYCYPPPGQVLPDERERLAAALAGSDATEAVAVLPTLLDALRIDTLGLLRAEVPGLHPTRTALVIAGEEPVGVVGEVAGEVLEAHGIDERVGWLDLDLEALLAQPRRDDTMQPLTRYPSSDLDLAFVVDDAVPAAAVEATLVDAGGELLEWVRLFDVFRSDQLGPGHRSLAYRLRFRALDHTLTDDELAAVRQRAIEAVETSHSARLRS